MAEMHIENPPTYVQITPLHNHYIYHLLNKKYNLSTTKIKGFPHRQDKHFIKIALNIKTNYKNVILIVIHNHQCLK
jgi:hypothetical protein